MLIMETVALVNFSTFVANLNLLMHKLALAAVTKMLEAGGLSGAFWSSIQVCKFSSELNRSSGSVYQQCS